MRTYYSLNKYLQDTFGCKVYKVALSGGFTCPNRDGTIGTGGCIFCSAGGSGDFAESPELPIKEQLMLGKERIKKKVHGGKYIAYFQSFTGTYAPVEKLRKLYSEAVSDPEVAALSVATRPDCLPDDVCSLLEEMNKIKPVFVELGLQTIHPKSAEYIRRGYPLEVYDDAMEKLTKIGVNKVVHVILGLPGESKEDMVKTVKYVVDSGADGIKLQLLHVLKGTDLAKDYLAGKFSTLNLDEYIDILDACLEVIPQNVVIHRLTGDGAKKDLIAPMWSANKKNVLNTIQKQFACIK